MSFRKYIEHPVYRTPEEIDTRKRKVIYACYTQLQQFNAGSIAAGVSCHTFVQPIAN
jgi:hypothetical protein